MPSTIRVKLIGRTLTKEEADAEEEKGNYVTKTEDGYRRIVAARSRRIS